MSVDHFPSGFARARRTNLLWLSVFAGMIMGSSAVAALPGSKVARIGYLVTGSLDSAETRAGLDVFKQALRELGYVEGQSIAFEHRAADGKIERLAALAVELAQRKVDLIVAIATPAARAARQATTTIPIVAVAMGEPVGDGLVTSLARPGGNLTGTTFLGPELTPKRLELLRDTLPTATRIGVLWHPGAFSERTTQEMLEQARAAARVLRLTLQFVAVNSAQEIEQAFATMVRNRADALIVFPSTMLYNERRQIAALAATHRLPAIYNAREFVDLGGLMAYGAVLRDLQRRAATHVDRILKGAKPAELPVEQPMTFELALNLKTAQALKITIPQAVLMRADHVVR